MVEQMYIEKNAYIFEFILENNISMSFLQQKLMKERKLNIKKIIVSLVIVSAFLVNGVQSHATVKSWKVYHDQGAGSNEGVFICKESMPKGGTNVLVEMTSYSNISNTKIKTYRTLYPESCKYLTSSTKEVSLKVQADKAEYIEVSMSTTSSKSTWAKGTISR